MTNADITRLVKLIARTTYRYGRALFREHPVMAMIAITLASLLLFLVLASTGQSMPAALIGALAVAMPVLFVVRRRHRR